MRNNLEIFNNDLIIGIKLFLLRISFNGILIIKFNRKNSVNYSLFEIFYS